MKSNDGASSIYWKRSRVHRASLRILWVLFHLGNYPVLYLTYPANFTIPSDLLFLFLPIVNDTSKDRWKKEQADHYRRHRLVVNHIKANKDVDIDILEKVLCFDEYMGTQGRSGTMLRYLQYSRFYAFAGTSHRICNSFHRACRIRTPRILRGNLWLLFNKRSKY